MKWAELTAEQLAATDRTTPVILSLGAVEQHGPILPVETDNLIGRKLLDAVDERIGERILILPQISVCCSGHHMDFAGGLSVRHETLLAYISDIIESVIQNGHKTIIFFNSHGGNLAIGQVVLEKLGERHPDCRLFFFTWWNVVLEELREVQESGPGGVGHACEFETSLIAHFAPEYVDGKEMPRTRMAQTYDWAATDLLNAPHGTFYRNMMHLSGGTGVLGAPEYASADKGRRIADLVVGKLVAMVGDILEGTPG